MVFNLAFGNAVFCREKLKRLGRISSADDLVEVKYFE